MGLAVAVAVSVRNSRSMAKKGKASSSVVKVKLEASMVELLPHYFSNCYKAFLIAGKGM